MNAALAGKLYALQREVLDALLADRIVALRPEPPRPAYRARPGVSVVPIVGAIENRRGILSELLGIGVSTSELRAAIRALETDPDTQSVVLLFDSPGGEVIGCQETAAAIRSLAKKKHVTAMVDGIAASAAYWLASGASEIVVTPSGSVGSIGVYGTHEDISAAAERLGVKTTLVSSSLEKVEGNPFEKLSDPARADMQSKVDAYARDFQTDVAIGRRTTLQAVRTDYGKGRMLLARDAVKVGMADRTGTIETVMVEASGRAAAFRAEMTRRTRLNAAYRASLTPRG
jgi:signal peptide peptidase SppA